MRLLLVEDDVMVASGIKLGLAGAGYAVDWVGSAERALEVTRSEAFDLAVIDIGLPGMDGLALTQALRKEGHAMPVLILTARDALQDRVQGLDMGGDDYMVKPFELPELLARLRALLRRSQAATSATLTFGPLELDTALRQACIRPAGAAGPCLPIELGPREWTVMEYLMLQAPKPANKDKLLQALTGWDKEITPNAVEVYISRLRGKLEPHGLALRSIRGFGYRLEMLAPAGDAGAAVPAPAA
jgi:DNA-binding response OmpR family regulator